MSVTSNIFAGHYTNKASSSFKDHANENDHLLELFEQDLAYEFELETHPKRHRIFEIAWELGRDYGHDNVYAKYKMLTELLGEPS